MRKELIAWVRKEIGPIASPDAIQWAPALPKTRSGKIMRRILRKIAANETDSLGDTSTLADPAVVTELVDNRVRRRPLHRHAGPGPNHVADGRERWPTSPMRAAGLAASSHLADF